MRISNENGAPKKRENTIWVARFPVRENLFIKDVRVCSSPPPYMKYDFFREFPEAGEVQKTLVNDLFYSVCVKNSIFSFIFIKKETFDNTEKNKLQ